MSLRFRLDVTAPVHSWCLVMGSGVSEDWSWGWDTCVIFLLSLTKASAAVNTHKVHAFISPVRWMSESELTGFVLCTLWLCTYHHKEFPISLWGCATARTASNICFSLALSTVH